MEEAWEGIEDGETLCKRSVNALIGLLALDQSKLYSHHCSTSSEDMPERASLQSILRAGDTTLYDFVTVTNLLGNCSHRPIHDLCLSVEAVRVGQLLHVLKASGALPIELRVDSCLYKPHQAKAR